jgi:DnaJ-class molecular chaperone
MCKTCNGTGYEYDVCMMCDGSGIGRADTACWKCMGKGVVPVPCSECYGEDEE